MKSLALIVAGAVALQAAPAASQMVKAQDPQSLVKALQAEGYAAKLDKDKDGDPMIASGVSGTKFHIFFYNCTKNKNCATIQFASGYNFEKALPLEKINEWNRGNRFARAYLDEENDPMLEMDVDLDDGGVSRALFIDNLEFWTTSVDRFERHIGYRK